MVACVMFMCPKNHSRSIVDMAECQSRATFCDLSAQPASLRLDRWRRRWGFGWRRRERSWCRRRRRRTRRRRRSSHAHTLQIRNSVTVDIIDHQQDLACGSVHIAPTSCISRGLIHKCEGGVPHDGLCTVCRRDGALAAHGGIVAARMRKRGRGWFGNLVGRKWRGRWWRGCRWRVWWR